MNSIILAFRDLIIFDNISVLACVIPFVHFMVSSLLYLLASSLLCLIQGLLQKYKMRNVEPNLFYLTLEATVRGRSEAATKTQLATIVNAVSPGRDDPVPDCCKTVQSYLFGASFVAY